nr:ABC transporter C family member 13 isoform X1 [Ipomoea batatas]
MPYFAIKPLGISAKEKLFSSFIIQSNLFCIWMAIPMSWFSKGSTSYDGYVLAVSMGLASVLKSFLDTQYTFRLSKLKLKLRSSIMTLIYRKCLCTNLAERSKFSEGEIQTFMSVDADRTVNLCNSFHDMWRLKFSNFYL